MNKQKKKTTYTNAPIKAFEKKDRKVFNEAWLKGKTNPRYTWNIKLGDTVIVLSGSDKGKTGKVTKVMPKKAKVIVEGINIVKKHRKLPNQSQGEITETPAPVWIWKVAIAVDKDGQKVASRVRIQDGKRIAVRTGEKLD